MTVLGPGFVRPRARPARRAGRFDVEAVREQFPILTVRPCGKSLAYLDETRQRARSRRSWIDALVAGLERMQEVFG